GTITVNGHQQRLGPRLNGLFRLEPRQARNLCRQNPTGLAQLDREHERVLVVQGWPDGKANQTSMSSRGSSRGCSPADAINSLPLALMGSVCALAQERWPRWVRRREFQTNGRPHRGPLVRCGFLSLWID